MREELDAESSEEELEREDDDMGGVDADAGRPYSPESEVAALDGSISTITRLEEEKLLREKTKNKTFSPPSPVMGGLRIIMPRDEEVESSNEDNDASDDDIDENGRYIPTRPISRADMKSCALDLAQRRSEIENFLGTNHAQQRERNR